MATTTPPEYVLDDFYRAAVVRLADENERILSDRIKLVVKPKPKFVSEKLWFKLAAIFLNIEKHLNSSPYMDTSSQKEESND